MTRAVYRARTYLSLPRDLLRRGPTPRGSGSSEAPSTLTPLRGERLRLLGLLLDEHGAEARQVRAAPRVRLRVDEREDARPRRVGLGRRLERLEEDVLALAESRFFGMVMSRSFVSRSALNVPTCVWTFATRSVRCQFLVNPTHRLVSTRVPT